MLLVTQHATNYGVLHTAQGWFRVLSVCFRWPIGLAIYWFDIAVTYNNVYVGMRALPIRHHSSGSCHNVQFSNIAGPLILGRWATIDPRHASCSALPWSRLNSPGRPTYFEWMRHAMNTLRGMEAVFGVIVRALSGLWVQLCDVF